MKFYEVHNPFYALIMAKSKKDAIAQYTKTIAADEDNTLKKEMKEVNRDYAVAVYSRGLSEDDKNIPIEYLVEDIQSNRQMTLLLDRTLA